MQFLQKTNCILLPDTRIPETSENQHWDFGLSLSHDKTDFGIWTEKVQFMNGSLDFKWLPKYWTFF